MGHHNFNETGLSQWTSTGHTPSGTAGGQLTEMQTRTGMSMSAGGHTVQLNDVEQQVMPPAMARALRKKKFTNKPVT